MTGQRRLIGSVEQRRAPIDPMVLIIKLQLSVPIGGTADGLLQGDRFFQVEKLFCAVD